MRIKQACAAMAHPAFCRVARPHLGELIEELASRWEARCESARHERRRRGRRRQSGAGPKYEFVFTRLLATVVHLRTGLTHEALGVIYEVGSSTIGRAISEIRPLLSERGFAVPDRPGLRLHTLEDVFAYAAAENVTLRIDGTETQVRRPRANRSGRRAFVSGKSRQNTIKTTAISDHQGRTLWSGAVRPGRMHDQTCARTEGIAEQFRRHPRVKAEVEVGYRGLANEFPDQVSAPPRKPKDFDEAPLTERHGWREQRRRQSSRRICVEHTTAGTGSGARCSGIPDGARTTATRTGPSPVRSPTGPQSGPPGTSRALNSCPHAQRPAGLPYQPNPQASTASQHSRGSP
ncbi:transposase family protein [Streptomyces sp. NPDC059378]|uniref:transposase family protein n=1 Tax=Streptomyces sp. NPDC059378 TaxID=3346815 RepID=UPI0036AEBEEB